MSPCGSFSSQLSYNPGQNSLSLGNCKPELSGRPLGPYLEPLVMADCTPRPLSKRQIHSPPRKIPHPASYNLLELNGGIWPKSCGGKLHPSFQSRGQYIKVGPSRLTSIFGGNVLTWVKPFLFPDLTFGVVPWCLFAIRRDPEVKMAQRLFSFY